MKHLPIFFLFLLAGIIPLFAQQTLDGSLMHDGLTRTYKLYIPASYDGSEPFPLVCNYHGFGSNAEQQLFYSDFRPIADTANFLVVHPEGTLFDNNGHWNVGGVWHASSTADDVGFTAALLDTLGSLYNLDTDRIYATGMSNGGYMSYELACQLSDRITAIASVTGSMTPSTLGNCAPTHPMPVMQIHGTADATVPYNGAIWSSSMEELVAYWVDFNMCDSVGVDSTFADLVLTDGSSVRRTAHPNGQQGATVELYTVNGGGHTWPGTAFVFPGTNLDITASVEIWNFFAQYDLATLTESTTHVQERASLGLSLYPNPATDKVHIQGLTKESSFALLNIQGQTLKQGTLSPDHAFVDLSDEVAGVYILRMTGQTLRLLKQ